MPVFIERFLIVVCAAAFYGLVINNTMGFDIHQRIGLGMLLVGAAYFLGHTAYKKPNSSVPAQHGAISVESSKASGNASANGDHSVANTGNGNTINRSSPPEKKSPKKE